MLDLAQREQRHDPETYVFKRDNGVSHDSLSHEGRGAPTAYTGMIYSAFRPSDDACVYGYLVPSNFFFLNELENLSQRLKTPKSESLARDIRSGIEKYAVIDNLYAYEVDGLGNALFIDDANIPSLLSLPLLAGASLDVDVYRNSREFILSHENPYFFSGVRASGVGSQHTPKNHVWPIAMSVEALTSPSNEKKLKTLDILETTDAGTGNMHEAFNVDRPEEFSRAWFSWADMTYVQLVLDSVGYQAQ